MTMHRGKDHTSVLDVLIQVMKKASRKTRKKNEPMRPAGVR